MADNEVSSDQMFAECNERLDLMILGLVDTARTQGALMLGPLDFLKMRNTFKQQVNDFMLPFLAATAVTRLVNQELAEALDTPNT